MSETQEDIVVALRKEAALSRGMEGDYYGEQYATDDSLLDEAADEIERLREENAKLRALCEIPPCMKVP